MRKIIICSIVIYCSSVFAQTNDEQFNSFFQNFKIAVQSNNIYEIAGLTNFPFIWEWVGVKEEISRDLFLTNPYIPDYSILSKAKFNKTITLSKNKSEQETVYFCFEDGYYVLNHSIENTTENWMSYSDYYFGLINGEYKYIKQQSGD